MADIMIMGALTRSIRGALVGLVLMAPAWAMAVGVGESCQCRNASNVPTRVIEHDMRIGEREGLLLPVHCMRVARMALDRGDVQIRADVQSIQKRAGKVIGNNPPSVVDKSALPLSGDKHDFLGYSAQYYSIRGGGEPSPDLIARRPVADEQAFIAVGKHVELMALTFFYTKEERYAESAADWLRQWFLKPATRMNPNGQFGSMRRNGRSDGFPVALFANVFIRLIDSAVLIESSRAWSSKDSSGFKEWTKHLAVWMNTSEAGLTKKNKNNNHGTYFRLLSALLYLYADAPEKASQHIRSYLQLMEHQFESSGKQPYEMERRNNLDYHRFNLRAVVGLAMLADRTQTFDLWGYKTQHAATLKNALLFVAPFAVGREQWPSFPSENYPVNGPQMAELFAQAIIGYPGSETLRRVANSLGEKYGNDLFRLKYPADCNEGCQCESDNSSINDGVDSANRATR